MKIFFFSSIGFSIGSSPEDVREIERHPFFANIPFRMYEEKKVSSSSFFRIKIVHGNRLIFFSRYNHFSNQNLIPILIHVILILNLPMNLYVSHHLVLKRLFYRLEENLFDFRQ